MASDAFENLATLLAAGRVTPEQPVDATRSGYDAMGAMIPLVEGTTTEAVDHGAVRGEWVRAPGISSDRVVVWYHGGGYVIGSTSSHRPLASRLSQTADAAVLVVDYRLAPEHPHPAAVDDALAAYQFVLDEGFDPGRVAFGGDSAGAGLAVAALFAARDGGQPLPAAVVLSSPWLDLAGNGESMATNVETDIILSPGLLHHWATLYLGDTDPEAPLASPIYGDLSGLPPLLVHAAAGELLVDDAARFAEAVAASGGVVTLEIDDDMMHHWHVFAGLFPEADEAVSRFGSWLASQLG